jgi:cobyrinic acid a,c-diamide synthase
LCQWLDLPRIAVVDVQNLTKCGLPLRQPKLDGLLLDRVRDDYDAAYWQTTLESLWKTPVLGWLDEAAPLRAACASLAAGGQPSRELCTAIGRRLLPSLRLNLLRQLARRPAALPFEPEAWLLGAGQRSFRIAVAMDETYCGYYPETLDLLEAAGAELCDFSPLRSESIPDDVDVVYIGCGHPERDAEKLAANHCLKQSLRSHAAAGGRIYAEGGGLAYVCREMVLSDGRSIPMTGLLPATARLLDSTTVLQPAEITFGINSWLAPACVSLRGYRHTGWQIEPHGNLLTFADNPEQRFDMLGRDNVIGSRILINLAANRHLLRRFFEPYLPVATALRRTRE